MSAIQHGLVSLLCLIASVDRAAVAASWSDTLNDCFGSPIKSYISFPDEEYIKDITYAKGNYVAVTSDGRALISQSGFQWSVSEVSPTQDRIQSIATNGDAFIAVLFNGQFFKSIDAKTWQLVFEDSELISFDIESNGKEFAVVARSPHYRGSVLLHSEDNGQVWIEQSLHGNDKKVFFQYLSVVNSKYIYSASQLYQSVDGKSWEPMITTGAKNVFGHFATNGNVYVQVLGTQNLGISRDGLHWEAILLEEQLSFAINDIQWVKDQFVMVGHCGTIYISEDGVKWKRVATKLGQKGESSNVQFDRLHAIASNGKTMVTVGAAAVTDSNRKAALVLISNDGKHWENISDRVSKALVSAAKPRQR